MSSAEVSPLQKWVEQERTVYPHAVSFQAARHQLELAEASEEGQFYACMMAAISCAFALEAFLNLLGQETKVDAHEGFERSSPARKLQLVGDALDFGIDRGRRPFQTFGGLIRFRNTMAHGKVVTVRSAAEVRLAPGERPSAPKVQWEEYSTLANVRRIVEDTEAMIEVLRQAASLPATTLFTMAEGSAHHRRMDRDL